MALQSKNRRYSKQREAVLQAVMRADVHPTAEWVYETVREDLPNISLGTVYRNLKLLTDEGRLQEVVLDDNVTRYDGNTSEHYHCICERCGKILDVDLDADEAFAELTEQINDFSVLDHNLEFYGLCEKCAEESEPAET